MTQDMIDTAWRTARGALLEGRTPAGCWRGELAASPLATAVAISALCTHGAADHRGAVLDSCAWLRHRQSAAGGWGDTVDSPPNLAATLLGVAALSLAAATPGSPDPAVDRAWTWLRGHGAAAPADIPAALGAAYGADRTFAVPIQANAALAGLLPWSQVPRLPFELACLPRAWFRWLRLHVVSYALPALVAIGQAQHTQAPPRQAWLRRCRDAARQPSLRLLARLQPRDGGFLEAIPLTAFVVMSLTAAGQRDHPVARRGVQFLLDTRRADGSWPVDIDLATWVTTLSVQALAAGPVGLAGLADPQPTLEWLRRAQWQTRHPYTDAEPGGWGWTDRDGAVPDVDDTAGALVALRLLGEPATAPAVTAGLSWLLRLQNADGGWPTFCRGWNRLPFDRSAADLTAHALRALHAWAPAGHTWPGARAMQRGLRHLETRQAADGSWLPLWFGNQSTPGLTNPVYGTALVLRALCEVAPGRGPAAGRAVSYLLDAQNRDGSWGGAREVPGSIEETGAALAALAACGQDPRAREASGRAAAYLAGRVLDGSWTRPAPIGLYFARLWYAEQVYPLVWAVTGLAAARTGTPPGAPAGRAPTADDLPPRREERRA